MQYRTIITTEYLFYISYEPVERDEIKNVMCNTINENYLYQLAKAKTADFL